MKERWRKIESIFKNQGVDFGKYLAPGATEDELITVEKATGLLLPEDVKSFYKVHNAQNIDVYGILFGLELLSTNRIIENWNNWMNIEGDGLNEELADSMSSKPEGYIRPLYVNTKWLPLTHDQGGNHIGLDFDPDIKGAAGQIIAFGRDDDEKKLVGSSFCEFIDTYIHQLETIPWKLEPEYGWKIEDDRYAEIHYHDWY